MSAEKAVAPPLGPTSRSMVGRRFGRLRVVSFSHRAVGGTMWNCVCDCGRSTIAKIGKLTMGRTRSCGCFHDEEIGRRAFKHGHARISGHTKTYERWKGMHQRCTNQNHISFKWYGARGIKVCERWKSYERFWEDMGEAPNGALIDRINNDGNYEPGNCRWTDPTTSARNRRERRKA